MVVGALVGWVILPRDGPLVDPFGGFLLTGLPLELSCELGETVTFVAPGDGLDCDAEITCRQHVGIELSERFSTTKPSPKSVKVNWYASEMSDWPAAAGASGRRRRKWVGGGGADMMAT